MTLGFFLRPTLLNTALGQIRTSPAAAVLVFFTIYSVISAYFLPRFFEDSLQVLPVARQTSPTATLVALEPTSANISQSVYMIGNLGLFLLFYCLFSLPDGMRRAGALINVAAIVHIFFGALSALPANAALAAVFDFIRSANYAILTGHEIGGVVRIIGAAAEASVFGTMSSAFFVYYSIRFVQTRGLWLGVMALTMFWATIASLSSGAFVSLAVIFALWSLQTSFLLVRDGLRSEDLTLLLVNAVAIAVVVMTLFFEPARDVFNTMYESLLGSKLQSDSGVERSFWNTQAMANFYETYGMGVGLGGARASSLGVVLLSNTGFVGTILYTAFLAFAFIRPMTTDLHHPQSADAMLRRRMFIAVRGAAISLIAGFMVISTTLPVLPLFYVFAAIAAASLKPAFAPHGVTVQKEKQPQIDLRRRSQRKPSTAS